MIQLHFLNSQMQYRYEINSLIFKLRNLDPYETIAVTQKLRAYVQPITE